MDVEVLKKQLDADDPAARQQFRDTLVALRPEAWELIVTRFTPLVFAIARRILQNKEDAEDASQETFIRLVRDRAQYDPTQPFGPWLARMAVHAAIDVLRKERVRGRRASRVRSLSAPAVRGDEEAPPEIERILNAVARNPEQLTMFKELLARVEHCLKRLPAKEKSVFLLIIHEHLSYAQASATLGLPLGTVRSTLHQARALLKDCVGS